jgi:hypothetical protein
MSLVGPRPLVEGELEAHNGSKKYWKDKPGITGWWACHGRSNLNYQERLELECYYVDKTLLIKDIIDDHNKVYLFTRPRRFGKTLTLDMVRTFFERTKEDTSVYFSDMKSGQPVKNTGITRENTR